MGWANGQGTNASSATGDNPGGGRSGSKDPARLSSLWLKQSWSHTLGERLQLKRRPAPDCRATLRFADTVMLHTNILHTNI